MSLLGEHVLMRVYLDSADRAPHTPTYERVIKLARREGLAGATVLRGILGLGAGGEVRRHKAWSVVEHVPVIVEIVDDAGKIVALLERAVDELMIDGMVTLERANVMMYRGRDVEARGAAGAAAPLRLGELLEPLATLPDIQLKGHMTTQTNGVLLRIFVGESDVAEGRPLHEAVVEKARQLGLAGATVLRGVEGFGAHSVVHKAGLLDMSTDLPIVIEIVDSDQNVRALLPYLETVVHDGMITMEHVMVLVYRGRA